MALIDIDRHILTQIIGYKEKKKECYKDFAETWRRLLDCADRGDCLYWTKSVSKREKERELQSNRISFFAATRKINKIVTKISILSAKQEALLQHLVSLVKEVDTNKGMETGKIGENNDRPSKKDN